MVTWTYSTGSGLGGGLASLHQLHLPLQRLHLSLQHLRHSQTSLKRDWVHPLDLVHHLDLMHHLAGNDTEPSYLAAFLEIWPARPVAP